MKVHSVKLVLAAFVGLLVLDDSRVVSASPPGWTQWRGPNRNSVSSDDSPWPNSLGALTKRWRVELGPGYSGPIVTGDHVFVTETSNKETEIVRCLDRQSGKEQWRASWSGAISVPFFAKSNGDWIRSTPAFDGSSLYVGGIKDVLVCLDAANGAERWRIDFPAKFNSPVPSFGFVSSPLIVEEFVFVQAGGALVKLDKRTGEILWKAAEDGGGINSAFSSPVLTRINGREQLLVQMREELIGLNPSDGSVLWRQVVPAYRGMNILTPLVFDNGIFTSTYKNGSYYYQVSELDGVSTVAELWRTPAQGYMSSPVLIGHHAYLHLGNGRFSCVELRTGKETWRTKPFGKYWSMVAQENRILALDERGDLLLIQADPAEFRLLDRKTVSEQECWAHLAVSHRDIVVRDLAGVTLFDWQQETK